MADALTRAHTPFPCLLDRSCLQLVGISWTIGPFVATFLLLPPAQHLMLQAPVLALLMRRNRSGAAQLLSGAGHAMSMSVRFPGSKSTFANVFC